MPETAESHSQSDEEPQCTNVQETFHQVQKLLDSEESFNRIRRENSSTEPNKQLVSSKMRSKLLTWLQKLALTTFKLHHVTFITAVSIFDQYLQSVNEHPSGLQLTGCACLFIASKLKEEIIVAPDCYVAASCNIYSKKQLLQKERIICSHLNFKKLREGILRRVVEACRILKMEQNIQTAMTFLGQFMKNERFFEWKEDKVVYAVLSLVKISQQRQISPNDLDSLGSWL